MRMVWKGNRKDPQLHGREWAFIRAHQAPFNEWPNSQESNETVGKV